MTFRWPRHVIPGFGLSLGITVVYLSVIVLLPLAGLVAKACTGTWEHFWSVVSNDRALASYQASFGISFAAALINSFFGLIIAWTLVRYDFPGRRLVDALVDLPFALPTAVAGLALTSLYVETGMLGQPLLEWFGIRVAYTQLGILIALIFIGLPFVVRTLQPVIADLSLEYEEAAACLGASRAFTLRRIVIPALIPAMLTGGMLAFGRAVGEFGSVVFIAGNLPYKTEITPLLITIQLEQYDDIGAAALGLVMLLAALGILLAAGALQKWSARVLGHRLELD